MSYRNKTYVIFDGDNDMWAYAFMKGWKSNDNVDFDFYDAHDLRPLTDGATEETVKQSLRARMERAKQVVLLVGESTKSLYRFVRWEIQLAIDKGLPIVVANLNGSRVLDSAKCPPILRNHCAVHVAFQMKIIKHALDGFVDWYNSPSRDPASGWRYYSDDVYSQIGL